MQTKNDDWQVRKLKEVYKGYFSAIRARAKEGRPYMLRSFLSVLQHEGLGIERLDAALDKPGKTIVVINMGQLLRKDGVLERLQGRHIAIEGPAE